MTDAFFIVICRGDTSPAGERGKFELATRTLFRTRVAAEDYATGINESREPLVVSGRFLSLRIDDGRFE